MPKHFKLTKNSIVKWGRTLYQIEATVSFGSVKKGQLGGWVESADVIAENDVWLYPDVMADKDARFHAGEFYAGVFRGGEFRGGEFYAGEFWGGVFWGGVFRGGVFYAGEFWGGVFWGGVFRGGVFKVTSDYLAICSVGSDGGVLTAYIANGKIEVNRGCFGGTLAEFKAAVKQKHGSSETAKEYALAIKLIELRFKAKLTKKARGE